MPTFSCFVADYNLTSDLPVVTDLSLDGNPPGSYFRSASGAANLDIAFDWSRRGLFPNLVDSQGVDQGHLMQALGQLLGLNGTSVPPAFGLLLTNMFKPRPQEYGFMFDLEHDGGGFGPRQGCALFLSAMKAAMPDGASAADFHAFVGYTVVHELGHGFNLWHTSDAAFMQPNPVPGALGPRAFAGVHQHYLALAARPDMAPFVLPGPGTSDFLTLAPGFHADASQPFAGQPEAKPPLAIEIALTPSAFWSFHPVELDVKIRNRAPNGAPLQIPDEIDPGSPLFQIWITQPTGERVRFCPPARFCRSNGEREVTRGKPFQRDIAIFRQGNRDTFAAPGIYQVQAALRLASGRFALSNIAQCEVLPANPADQAWQDANALAREPEVRRLLRYKSGLPPHHLQVRLAAFTEQYEQHPVTPALHYAFGKALLRTADRAPRAYADHLRQRGVSHLRSALDKSGLGAHGSATAARLINANARRTKK